MKRIYFLLRVPVSLFVIFISLQSFSSNDFVAPVKLMLFYSSIGGGHLSAAKNIEADFKKESPDSLVIRKDITDFNTPRNSLENRLYWFIVKNFPNLFDSMYRSAMSNGRAADDLFNLATHYNLNELAAYINQEKPTHIVFTHYGSALHVGVLRERGLISKNIKLAWLHTDYIEGYFPRISKIMDMTFLGADFVYDTWLKAGVPEEKMKVTGIPVTYAVNEIRADTDSFLLSKGLDPKLPLITISSGLEGVGDYSKIVSSIDRFVTAPVQVVAVCGQSKSNFKALERLQKQLSSKVKLTIYPLIPVEDLVMFAHASEVYITKSGGLSPTEGFMLNKPMVLLDIYGGHERENASRFSEQGLALVQSDEAFVGRDVQWLFQDSEIKQLLLSRQEKFKKAAHRSGITDFLLGKNISENCKNALSIARPYRIRQSSEVNYVSF